MMEFFYYLLKVIGCSGILFLYYHMALRNKEFHQWNRFYLLITVILSLTLPLIQVTIYRQLQESPTDAIQILQVVQSANDYLEEVTIYSSKPQKGYDVLFIYYCIVSLIVFLLFIRSLIRVLSIIRSEEMLKINEVNFINTNVSGTPFTFFHYIFWNSDIDLSTESGQRIFNHELVHVKEKHSLDRIFMQIILFVFWCNPFFWLIRREIRTIHEFIADKKSLAGEDHSVFAAMILQAAYPKQFSSITNHFFQTSIKRRLQMLNKIQNPRVNYLYRIAVLPIIAITVLAFTIRTKTLSATEPLQKKMTVVIDAGHGKQDGRFTGAQFQDQYEDPIVLTIATKIKELNNDPNLEIVLSRPSDDMVSLEQRVALAKATAADLFISLHIGANLHNAEKSGLDVVISGRNKTFNSQNEMFASLLTQELKSIYNTKNFIRQSSGVYVLDKTPCPSVLLELGYLTNTGDLNFIQQPKNQEQIAKRILEAIEKYSAASSESIRIIPVTEERSLKNTKSDSIPGTLKNNRETKLRVTTREEIQLQSTSPVIEERETKKEIDGPVFTAVEIEAYIDKQVWRDF